MRLVTQIDDNGYLKEGDYIQPPKHCIKNYNQGKCKLFYTSIRSKEKGCFYTCPKGMSVYVARNGSIFTCMRERKSYNKEYAKKISADFYGKDAMEAVRFVESLNKK